MVTKGQSLVFAVLLLLLMTSGALAQGSEPSDTSPPPEPVITKTTTLEWVTVETEKGQERVLVPVTSVQSVQTEQVTGARAGTIDYTFEMWRALAWYYSGWPSNLYAYAKGRTSTSVVADWIWVFIQHERCDPGYTCISGKEWTWPNVDNGSRIEYNSTQAYKETHQIMQPTGRKHAAWGHHQAQVGGQQHIRNNQWGPESVIP